MDIRRTFFHYVLVWLLDTASLILAAFILSGFTLGDNIIQAIAAAFLISLALGSANYLIRPTLLRITMPINVLTFGFSTLFIDALIVMIVSISVPIIEVVDIGAGLLIALTLAAVHTLVYRLVPIDDDSSIFVRRIIELSKQQKIPISSVSSRGIVVMEIDGLSYRRLKHAVEKGYMPTIKTMLEVGTHKLTPFDCGIPSMTSSSQGGIMFGDNYDIPAFRWFDKDRGKMIVSNNYHDAAEMNNRLSHGQGLMRGGSSICNLFDGDAVKALFTMSSLRDTNQDRKKYRKEDFYLLYFKPYVFISSWAGLLWEAAVEIGQGLKQVILNVQPRVNRLKKGFPFVRGITNVVMREISTFMVALDIVRGIPATYTTYLGYDEVAHHAGPDTKDALKTLKALDKQIRFVHDVIDRRAPRPYDLFILSDHGQSRGATFKQRYDKSLGGLIESLVKSDVGVKEENVEKTLLVGAGYRIALATMLRGIEGQEPGWVKQKTLRLGQRVLKDKTARETIEQAPIKAEVVVAVSGNLANVYFTLKRGKMLLNELEANYPGLLDELVANEGIGLVIGHNAKEKPIVVGKNGIRNLATGKTTGADPLMKYDNPNLRAEQLKRLAEFPHAGDLIIISTLYPDGTVAAFEELVGNHGGLGGEQTTAFLLHPADMTIPEITSSTGIYHILNARREQVDRQGL